MVCARMSNEKETDIEKILQHELQSQELESRAL